MTAPVSHLNPLEQPQYTVIGGLREWAHASWPLVRLAVSPQGARLGPSWKWFPVPTYQFDWRDVEVVQVTPEILGFPGVVFKLSRPIRAQRAMLGWPRSATHPCFWIRPRDLSGLLPHLAQYVRVEHTRKRRWL